MSKFCILKYSKDYDYLLKKFALFNNKNFRLFYVKKFNPFRVEDIYFSDLENYGGLAVTLPITYEDAKNDLELLKHIVEKTVSYLESQNVNIIYYDNIFYKSERIKSLDSLDVNLLYIEDILNRVIKSYSFNRKNVEIAIISGDYFKTKIVINKIYDNINFLSLVEKDGNFYLYEELTDFVFCDQGLEISYINFIKSANIIINLCDNPYGFLKNIDSAIIIDLSNKINKGVLKNTVINNFSVKINDGYLKDYELELLLYAYSYHYRRFKDNDKDTDKFLNAKSEVKLLNAVFKNYSVLK